MLTPLPTALSALLLAALLSGCGNGDAPPPAGNTPAVETPQVDPTPGADSTPDAPNVQVWFTGGETPEPVTRRVDSPEPAAAFAALLAGPTEAERQRGLSSWFSDSTARALREVDLSDGFLVVDFAGLDRQIPNASSSAGSSSLLAALDSTAFQFEAVDSVEYRLDGTCEAFWNWLQRGCTVVHRP